MSNRDSIYARPPEVLSLDECAFYHTMEFPEVGLVPGLWDLRGVEARYLGHVSFAGKRILEVGPASGWLSFYMERQGAEVVALELDEQQEWDVVPYAHVDYRQWQRERQARLRLLNNSFWYGHRAYDSKVKVVYGSVYAIPHEIGRVDTSVLSAVLLHLRDPFSALQNTLALTDDKVIITETLFPQFLLCLLTEAAARAGVHLPMTVFLPRVSRPEMGTWWCLTPEAIRQFLAVLGFARQHTTYHFGARHRGRRQLMYTVVGERTTRADR